MSIRVHPVKGVSVTVPYMVPYAVAQLFFQARRNWGIATIAKQALVSKGAKQKDFAFPAQTVANPEVFDIPASWTVTAVQVKNDLSGVYEDAMSQFTVTNTTHNDAAGNAVDYKRYTFNLGYDTGARSVRVKWS